jgi:periplasmic divalent cation tolerance protein
MEYLLALTTCPNQEVAERLARLLVEARLAACITILPGGRSIYFWQGEMESSEEHLLLIKTRAACYNDLEQTIKAHHPYELPEIIAVPIVKGESGYLAWIDAMTQGDPCE